MIMVVMPRDEAERILQALVAAKYTATYTETRGGMLRQAQMSLFIAVDDQDLESVLTIIEEACGSEITVQADSETDGPAPMPARPRIGGAVVFVWDVERSEAY